MKHTQGKWTKNYWTVGRIEIVTDNNVICEIHQQHERLEQVANAKLIAAAPELLEACKLALRDYKYIDSLSDTPNILKQVIAKAEAL